MSVFDGEIDFKSMYMVDYMKKDLPFDPRPHPADDNCMIVGVERDALKARDKPFSSPDVFCPISKEYYKDAVKRFKEEYPKITEMHMSKDIDPTPIDHEIQDLKRTEYLVKYCSRELPFMSINLTRRAIALQTLRLPEDAHVPVTTNTSHFRSAPKEKYVHPSTQTCKIKYDDSLQKELRRILRTRTPESQYGACHGLLGRVILDTNPFGKPRKEPRYGKWRSPHFYTYYL